MKTLASSFPIASSPSLVQACGPRGVRRPAAEAKAATGLAERLVLTKNQVIRLERHSRVGGIAITSGTAWITETPGAEDVVAGAGEVVRIRGGWPVVVQALTDTVMVFSREGTT